MCVEPWPPNKSSASTNEQQLVELFGLCNDLFFKPMKYLFILLMGYYFSKQHYTFPKSTHLLDVALHKARGETIHPYIELLHELANHVDSFHSAGWIFRCLRAKNVWILHTEVSQMKKVKSDQ